MIHAYGTVEVKLIPKTCQFTVGPILQPVNKNDQLRGSIIIMAETVFEKRDITITKLNALTKEFMKILTKLEKPCLAVLKFNESPYEAEYENLRLAPQRRKYKPNYLV